MKPGANNLPTDVGSRGILFAAGPLQLLTNAAMSWDKSLLSLLLVLSLSGCATSRSYEEHARALSAYRVDPAIKSKMALGQRLELADIVRLSLNKVPDEAVVSYLKRQGSVYVLYPHDVSFLRNYDVNEPVIAYLVATPQLDARFKGKGYVPPNVCRPYYSRTVGIK
jgi:hypothetical protein